MSIVIAALRDVAGLRLPHQIYYIIADMLCCVGDVFAAIHMRRRFIIQTCVCVSVNEKGWMQMKKIREIKTENLTKRS